MLDLRRGASRTAARRGIDALVTRVLLVLVGTILLCHCGPAQELRGKWTTTDGGCLERTLAFTDSAHVVLASESQACYFELLGTETLEINRQDKVRHTMSFKHDGDRLSVDWPATFGGRPCRYERVKD